MLESKMSNADATESRSTPIHGDPLDAPGWVSATPRHARSRAPIPARRSRGTHPASPSPRPRLRAIVGCAALGIVSTLVLSTLGGLPLVTDEGAGGRGAAAGIAVPAASQADEDPSSLAITADSGPFHPIRADGEVDYGDAGARFGADRGGRAHEGQDVFAKSGTPLIAVRDGVVVERGNDGGRGNYVAIHSPAEDRTHVYLHMLRPTGLKPDEEVPAGTQVGAMGCTGSCYGTHLHFEIRRGDDIEGKPIDPLPQLERWPQAP